MVDQQTEVAKLLELASKFCAGMDQVRSSKAKHENSIETPPEKEDDAGAVGLSVY